MAVMSVVPRVAIRNMVVVTDLTPASEWALKYALSIARHFNSKVDLVHPIQPLSSSSSPATEKLQQRAAELAAEEKLRVEATQFSEVACSQWLLKGTPLEVVNRILSFEKTDLLVIAVHGAKGFRKIARGSAAEHFFRHIHCPLLAVGPAVRPCERSWEPKHILLVTDLQSSELAAARCAVFLAREHDAHLALMHVAPPTPAPYPQDQQAIARPYFVSRLKELLCYKAQLEYPADFWVEFGEDTVAEIVRVARQRLCDVIVLSVHREEPWGLHLVHEAYRIVAEAPCPVLITQRN